MYPLSPTICSVFSILFVCFTLDYLFLITLYFTHKFSLKLSNRYLEPDFTCCAFFYSKLSIWFSFKPTSLFILVLSSPLQRFLMWSHLEDPLEKEMATTHSIILAWEIPWTEKPGGQQSMGSQRVRHN